MTANGMYFWDYGNAFLLEASRAGADVMNPDGTFKYPSYVQDIMGPLYFDYGFGPFRWVCTSGNPIDLETTDHIAAEVLESIEVNAPARIRTQLKDNIHWIEKQVLIKWLLDRRHVSYMPIVKAGQRLRLPSTKPSVKER